MNAFEFIAGVLSHAEKMNNLAEQFANRNDHENALECAETAESAYDLATSHPEYGNYINAVDEAIATYDPNSKIQC
jgi:hypothetical protein